jgi:capsular exopolysaccharide synthesis family protein
MNTIRSNKAIREEKDMNLLSFIRFRFFPYWPLFALLIIFGSIAALFYLRWVHPTYEAKADLLIKDEKKGSDDSKVIESLNLFSTKKIVEDEIEVLHSQTLVREVVRHLRLYAPVFEKNKFKVYPAYTSSPVSIEMMDFDSLYKDHQKVFLDQVDFRYDNASGTVQIGRKFYPLNQWVRIPDSGLMLRFIPNPRFSGYWGKPLFFSVYNPKVITNSLVGGLNVYSANKLSSVVTLTMRDEIPQRAEDILNELINVYNHASIYDKNQLATNTLAFVEERLRIVKAELDSTDLRIRNFKAANGGADLSEQSTAFLRTVTDNDQKVSDIGMRMAVLDQVEKYVNNDAGTPGIVPSTLGINDPGLTAMLQKLFDARNNYEKLHQTVGENNPMVLSLESEIGKIRPNILENIRIQKLSLQASLSTLNTTNSFYSSRLQGVPEKERALLEVSRQEATLNNVYAFLLQKREEASLTYASTVSDSRTVNMAESSIDPVSPKRSMVLGLAVAIALILGILIVYAREFLNSKVLFRREIETYTSLPIVAEISKVPRKATVPGSSDMPPFLAEQLRQLRAALGLHGRHNTRKKILVTSSIPGEGKSFISTSLARSLAGSGKKVILIDLDLRNPKLSADFGVIGETGIAEFLQGGFEPYEIIKRTRYDQLFIAGAGKDEVYAPELTFNTRLRGLFEYLDTVFDFIIIDSAPVHPVSDAYILAEYCDLTLYIVRHDYTPKACIQLLDENIRIKPLKDPVIVFNGIKSRGLFKGQYGLDFGYGNEFAWKKSRKSALKKFDRTNS